MMGQQDAQEQLFYSFRLEDHVPGDHLLRQLDAVLNFERVRSTLASHYSPTGRPSIDPELMLRMLLIGYAYGIRSERTRGRFRCLSVSVDESIRQQTKALQDTEPFQRSRRLRKKVEMLFAHMKQQFRFTRLKLRGLSGASEECLLMATVQNLRRLARLRRPAIQTA